MSARLMAVQKELLLQAEHTKTQADKINSGSTSEHEALVAKLRQQVEQMEAEYRSAKAVKATLEAEAAAWRREGALQAALEAVQARATAAGEAGGQLLTYLAYPRCLIIRWT